MYSPGLLAGRARSLGAARFRLATKLRGEAPPRDGENRVCRYPGERDGWAPGWSKENPTWTWGKGERRRKGEGELKSPT